MDWTVLSAHITYSHNLQYSILSYYERPRPRRLILQYLWPDISFD
jgi:hypothetical protein